jgi:hypothetical protein
MLDWIAGNDQSDSLNLGLTRTACIEAGAILFAASKPNCIALDCDDSCVFLMSNKPFTQVSDFLRPYDATDVVDILYLLYLLREGMC